MTFLLNCWYAGGFSDEVNQTPMARTLLGQSLVFYRAASGLAVALSDRCPHRFAALHQGKVFGDSIRCPYHGLRFGPDGRCVDNPLGDGHIPQAARVHSFPVHEVDGIVWVWFGDQIADPSQIVRFEMFEQPDRWTTVKDRIGIAASYALVSDNLLDLSHAEFLHPDLATEGFNKRVNFSMSQEGEGVVANNWRPSEPITPAFRFILGEGAPDFVDHRSVVRWHAPANLYIDIGVTPVGRPESEAVKSVTAHLITPETLTTSHYFWKSARNHNINEPEFSKKIHALITKAFQTEDKPTIEAQERNLGGRSFEELQPVLLKSDAASARARRILNKKLAAQGGRAAPGDDLANTGDTPVAGEGEAAR